MFISLYVHADVLEAFMFVVFFLYRALQPMKKLKRGWLMGPIPVMRGKLEDVRCRFR